MIIEDNNRNNIFDFATKELSQDAILAWIINWNKCKDNEKLYNKSLKFISDIMQKANKKINIEEMNIEIFTQYHFIDVFVLLTQKDEDKDIRYGIIIEDKKLTTIHDEQLEKYRKVIEEKRKLDKDKIITVYYKPYEENSDINADVIIDREYMLENIFNEKIDNEIYNDYKEYLENIQKRYNDFEHIPIKNWNKYKELIFIFTQKYKELKDNRIEALHVRGSMFVDWYPKCNIPPKYSEFVDEIYLSLNINYDRYELRIRGIVNKYNSELRDELEEEIKLLLSDKFSLKKFTHKKGNNSINLSTIDLNPDLTYKDLINIIKDVENNINKL